MHAALITGRHRLELVDVAEPEPAPDGVVVAIDRCGIYGTDVHAYASGRPYNPAICGHEWTGPPRRGRGRRRIVAERKRPGRRRHPTGLWHL